MIDMARAIDGMQDLLAVCPCCGEVFRLVEGRFIFPKRQPRSSEYSEIVGEEVRLQKEEERLCASEDRFREALRRQRQSLIDNGRRIAKQRLKAIDPTFSANNIDPQDVKVVFHPVEYVIFHGLNSERGVRCIEFVSREPATAHQEVVTNSIERVVKHGKVEFETLRMNDDGSFDVKPA